MNTPSPAPTSPLYPMEHQQFLADVATTFVEGGGPYSWFQVEASKWWEPKLEGGTATPLKTAEGLDGPNRIGRIRCEKKDTEGYGEWQPFTFEIFERGFQRLIQGPVEGLSERYRASLIGDYMIRDAGSLDINAVDIVVQAAFYGEIVFS